MPDGLGAGTHLTYALSRQSSRGVQVGCTLLLALVLGGFGGAILLLASRHAEESFVVYAVGGGFALAGLLLLYSAVHQIFAMRTPQTDVEIDTEVLTRGTSVRLYFRQRGPASFESLRANLVGEESWWSGTGKQRRHHVEQLGIFNLFDSGAFDVGRDVPFERTVTVIVPDLPRASDPEHEETWQLEVWGKVRGRADFQHVFPMRVE